MYKNSMDVVKDLFECDFLEMYYDAVCGNNEHAKGAILGVKSAIETYKQLAQLFQAGYTSLSSELVIREDIADDEYSVMRRTSDMFRSYYSSAIDMVNALTTLVEGYERAEAASEHARETFDKNIITVLNRWFEKRGGHIDEQ